MRNLLFGIMLLATGCGPHQPREKKAQNDNTAVESKALTAIFGPLSVQQACDARQIFFESNTQQYREPSTMFVDLFKGAADVILIGDEHSSHEAETLAEVLKAIEQSASRPDCFLIEKDKNSTYAAALAKFFSDDDAALSTFDDPSYFMRWNGDMPSFVKYMTKLRSLGVKAIPIDDASAQDSSSVLANLNTRDQAMSVTVNKLFSDKICHKVLYSVGAFHIVKSYAGKDRKTLYHHLTDSGHKVKSVFLTIAGKMSAYSATGPAQYPNQNSTLSGFGHWSSDTFIPMGKMDTLACKSTLDILDYPYAFMNQKRTDSPLVYSPSIRQGPFPGFPGLPSSDDSDFFGRYSDFDAIWVHPCQERKCKQQDQVTRKTLVEAGIKLYQPLPFQEHELDWPVRFHNQQNSVGDQLATYIGNDGRGYLHGGCDLVSNVGAEVTIPITGHIEAGYYDLKYLPDGSYEKTMYRQGTTIPESVNNPLRYEIAVVHESGYRFEFHHIDPTTVPSVIAAAIAAKGTVAKGAVVGKVIAWPLSSINLPYHHLHYNVLSPYGIRFNCEYLSTALIDTIPPVFKNIYADYGSVNERLGSLQLSTRPKELVVEVEDRRDNSGYINLPQYVGVKFASGQEYSRDFRLNLAFDGKQISIANLYRDTIKLSDGSSVNTINDYWNKRFLIRIPLPTEAAGAFEIFAEDQAGNRTTKNGSMP